MSTQTLPADAGKTRKTGADPVWDAIRAEASADVEGEAVLASFLHATILNHNGLEGCLAFHIAGKIDGPALPTMLLRGLIDEVYADNPDIVEAARADLEAVRTRDPAARGYTQPLLYFKGFHALQTYRVAHALWREGRHALALYLQSRASEVFGVDIHPAAVIGRGILIDHATSVVIGETAVVEDDVSMLHEVTLGGTGKESGDRHPKVRRGVLIGAGAKILGNVEIGQGAKVGAGSVVLNDVRAHCTVAGVPARVIGCPEDEVPALSMDHGLPRDEQESQA